MRRRDRQAQGADGNESSGALGRQQRPTERGGGTGDPRQRPLAVTRHHAARREGFGRGAAEPRSGVSGAGRGGHPPQQPQALCLFPKQVPPILHVASPLRTQPRSQYRNPTSFPGPPQHSEHPMTQGPCLPPFLSISLILHALAAKQLPLRGLSPSLVTELTEGTLFSRPSTGS